MASVTKTPRLNPSEGSVDILMTSKSSPPDVADTLLHVHDISQKAGLPKHLQYLLTLKGDQDFISIHEWAARLCHALIVETGFFPAFDGPPDITAREALEIPDEIRIPRFVRKLSPECMFSDRGVYMLKYRAILMELVDKPLESVDAEPSAVGSIAVSSTTTESTMELDDDSSVQIVSSNESRQDPQEWRYRFSDDVNVTMIIMEDRLLLTATYKPGEGIRPINHQLTINIEEFLTLRVRMVPVRLRADQWIKKFDLNSTRLAGFFKNKFSITLMDKIDGVVFERRGLICLPDIVLLKILKMSSVRTILHMGRTCTDIYDIVKEDRLWQCLVKRDFPNEPLQPGPVGNTPTPAPDTPEASKKKDFYEIYKQKYITKHRGIHRLRTLPMLRFHPDLPRARRFPSHPFPFVRF